MSPSQINLFSTDDLNISDQSLKRSYSDSIEKENPVQNNFYGRKKKKSFSQKDIDKAVQTSTSGYMTRCRLLKQLKENNELNPADDVRTVSKIEGTKSKRISGKKNGKGRKIKKKGQNNSFNYVFTHDIFSKNDIYPKKKKNVIPSLFESESESEDDNIKLINNSIESHVLDKTKVFEHNLDSVLPSLISKGGDVKTYTNKKTICSKITEACEKQSNTSVEKKLNSIHDLQLIMNEPLITNELNYSSNPISNLLVNTKSSVNTKYSSLSSICKDTKKSTNILKLYPEISSECSSLSMLKSCLNPNEPVDILSMNDQQKSISDSNDWIFNDSNDLEQFVVTPEYVKKLEEELKMESKITNSTSNKNKIQANVLELPIEPNPEFNIEKILQDNHDVQLIKKPDVFSKNITNSHNYVDENPSCSIFNVEEISPSNDNKSLSITNISENITKIIQESKNDISYLLKDSNDESVNEMKSQNIELSFKTLNDSFHESNLLTDSNGESVNEMKSQNIELSFKTLNDSFHESNLLTALSIDKKCNCKTFFYVNVDNNKIFNSKSEHHAFDINLKKSRSDMYTKKHIEGNILHDLISKDKKCLISQMRSSNFDIPLLLELEGKESILKPLEISHKTTVSNDIDPNILSILKDVYVDIDYLSDNCETRERDKTPSKKLKFKNTFEPSVTVLTHNEKKKCYTINPYENKAVKNMNSISPNFNLSTNKKAQINCSKVMTKAPQINADKQTNCSSYNVNIDNYLKNASGNPYSEKCNSNKQNSQFSTTAKTIELSEDVNTSINCSEKLLIKEKDVSNLLPSSKCEHSYNNSTFCKEKFLPKKSTPLKVHTIIDKKESSNDNSMIDVSDTKQNLSTLLKKPTYKEKSFKAESESSNILLRSRELKNSGTSEIDIPLENSPSKIYSNIEPSFNNKNRINTSVINEDQVFYKSIFEVRNISNSSSENSFEDSSSEDELLISESLKNSTFNTFHKESLCSKKEENDFNNEYNKFQKTDLQDFSMDRMHNDSNDMPFKINSHYTDINFQPDISKISVSPNSSKYAKQEVVCDKSLDNENNKLPYNNMFDQNFCNVSTDNESSDEEGKLQIECPVENCSKNGSANITSMNSQNINENNTEINKNVSDSKIDNSFFEKVNVFYTNADSKKDSDIDIIPLDIIDVTNKCITTDKNNSCEPENILDDKLALNKDNDLNFMSSDLSVDTCNELFSILCTKDKNEFSKQIQDIFKEMMVGEPFVPLCTHLVAETDTENMELNSKSTTFDESLNVNSVANITTKVENEKEQNEYFSKLSETEQPIPDSNTMCKSENIVLSKKEKKKNNNQKNPSTQKKNIKSNIKIRLTFRDLINSNKPINELLESKEFRNLRFFNEGEIASSIGVLLFEKMIAVPIINGLAPFKIDYSQLESPQQIERLREINLHIECPTIVKLTSLTLALAKMIRKDSFIYLVLSVIRKNVLNKKMNMNHAIDNLIITNTTYFVDICVRLRLLKTLQTFIFDSMVILPNKYCCVIFISLLMWKNCLPMRINDEEDPVLVSVISCIIAKQKLYSEQIAGCDIFQRELINLLSIHFNYSFNTDLPVNFIQHINKPDFFVSIVVFLKCCKSKDMVEFILNCLFPALEYYLNTQINEENTLKIMQSIIMSIKPFRTSCNAIIATYLNKYKNSLNTKKSEKEHIYITIYNSYKILQEKFIEYLKDSRIRSRLFEECLITIVMVLGSVDYASSTIAIMKYHPKYKPSSGLLKKYIVYKSILGPDLWDKLTKMDDVNMIKCIINSAVLKIKNFSDIMLKLHTLVNSLCLT
ncbi:probable serine/threonine-protein kinase DDB_G0282963 isoform X17 [Daktulosphaira vitifoliae]|uniref:probable serine/threonine-protein kinase DDB_G0282963 isoform X15 n=1 Tax=Daktulosphaira vitifoliae TaxID=58002 RepID=UPI0021AA7702|nr:probable serine/threonine-protein kinase DDB_G0282963 isoform X15 [Daktulosphaira vitifoliae]XP_050522885.1 probable serine/threonine-protein kinase DDB_G0282963 isoform X16 [Daktulosphaira vitifoliae]XP_050522886.1 probable serine/threonine-protein kinase DDB_G0282963 isoform X17 [Daktulosphaira vitifoliae]